MAVGRMDEPLKITASMAASSGEALYVLSHPTPPSSYQEALPWFYR